MSQYHEQSYSDHGPDEVFGDHGPEPVYGDHGAEPVYSDHGAEPVYGDYGSGAAYSDDGSEAAYGDGGPAYADDGMAYADGGASSAQPLESEYERTYREAMGEDYREDDVYGYSDDQAPGAKGKGAGGPSPVLRKRLMFAAATVAILGAVAGGVTLAAPGSLDLEALKQQLPFVGGGQATESTESPKPGFEIGSLVKMLPFMGDANDQATVDKLQTTLEHVRKAVDMYAEENQALPGTAPVILAQMKAMQLKTTNPLLASEELTIELSDTPSAPGSVSYALIAGRYELRIGDVAGKSLTVADAEVIVQGTMSTKAALKPADTPDVAPQAKPSPVAGSAPSPQPTPPGLPVVPRNPAAVSGLPAPAVQPSLSPQQRLAKKLEQNRVFDKLRLKGISLVYEKRTNEAIATFKQALAIRPNDTSVTQWLNVVQGVVTKTHDEELAKYEEARTQAYKEAATKRAQFVPPPPPVVQQPTRPVRLVPEQDDASRMLEELKAGERVPLLAPPRLDER